MKVRFWGSRGSLPAARTAGMIEGKIFQALRKAQGQQFIDDAAIRDFIRRELPFNIRDTYGSNTSCVEITGGDTYVVCDAGTGIRDFGNHVLAAAAGQGPQVYHLFISHLHWDHIQGFPFFVPAYIPGNQIHIYGCHKELQQAFTNQQQSMHFPVSLTEMGAQITFHLLETDKTYQIAGFYVRAKSQRHPGGSYGYSFVKDGKKLVYSTDAEHKEDFVDEQYPFIAFFSAADLVIFDAQYTLLDAIDKKENWGHSSNIVGVELAVRSGVKRLCLFHLEHTHDDDTLQSIAEKTREYLQIFSHGNRTMEIEVAFDGLEISL